MSNIKNIKKNMTHIMTHDISLFIMNIFGVIVAISIGTFVSTETMYDLFDNQSNSKIVCELRK